MDGRSRVTTPSAPFLWSGRKEKIARQAQWGRVGVWCLLIKPVEMRRSAFHVLPLLQFGVEYAHEYDRT